jgi:hypothetical protein
MANSPVDSKNYQLKYHPFQPIDPLGQLVGEPYRYLGLNYETFQEDT